jgi:hydroxymethylglutaryl-CoA synthase
LKSQQLIGQASTMQNQPGNPFVYPKDVGIIAMDIYFPKTCVSQEELEKYDQVPAGKYTVGLGQKTMAFVGDREDVNSVCLTVVKNLFEKYNINPKDIGRLEVGTETIIDKSKAIKTVLMDLFKESGNFNVLGIDNKNACYGGTAALFNSIDWMESSYWDGRYALVVAADVAVYEKGPARPTGGCGCAAMLIGPNAPLVFERGLRSAHMEHVYDFYKPLPTSEYPTVDGKLSVSCYLRALDNCFQIYAKKFYAKEGRQYNFMNDADFYVFHAPYNKLVQKSFGRLFYNDFLLNKSNLAYKDVQHLADVPTEKSYDSREIEETFVKMSKNAYNTKVVPSTVVPTQIGNTYTASLYFGFASLLASVGSAGLQGKRLIMFSYGSGLASSMFSIKVQGCVDNIVKKMDVKNRLAQRTFVEPAKYSQVLDEKQKRYTLVEEFTPTGSVDELFPGTFYLTKIDKMHRRLYARKPVLASKL